MVLLTNIWHLPMLWWYIIPIALLFIWAGILVYESRVPHHKRILHKLRRRKPGYGQHKAHHHTT